MTIIDHMKSILARAEQTFDKDASVLVQFAAGDWAKIKAAVEEAGAALLDAPADVPPTAPAPVVEGATLAPLAPAPDAPLV